MPNNSNPTKPLRQLLAATATRNHWQSEPLPEDLVTMSDGELLGKIAAGEVLAIRRETIEKLLRQIDCQRSFREGGQP